MTNIEKFTAFKEWAIVCEALGQGKQSIIFRKGGIHEGQKGFQFLHDEFLLFPTRFHEQEQNLKLDNNHEEEPLPSEYNLGEKVQIHYFCKIRKIKTIDNWETVKSLEPFHIWDEATIRDRFEWSKNGEEQPFISLAVLRVYKLAQVVEFPYEKKFGGCRSWLDVPVFNEDHIQSSQPVIEDQKFEILFSQLKERLEII